MIYISKPTKRHILNQGRFIIRMISPGLELNNPADRRFGPLGRAGHATLEPGWLNDTHLANATIETPL
jgi:hypothetical protein